MGDYSIRCQISRLRPAPIELSLTPNLCGASLEMTGFEIASVEMTPEREFLTIFGGLAMVGG
jgi:hypothetical protein